MLFDRIQEQFSPSIRSRGAAYFTGHRVRITDFKADQVIAKVRGTRNYNAHLGVEGRSLLGNCDCHYFREQQELCKHLWALLLAVQQREPQWQAAAAGIVADPEEAPLEADDDDEDDGDDDGTLIQGPAAEAGLSRYSKAKLAAQLSKSPPPAWQKTLRKAGLAEAAEAAPVLAALWPAERRAYYLLDLGLDARAKRPKPGPAPSPGIGLELAFSDPFSNGSWTKPKYMKLGLALVSQAPDPLDRQVLALLCPVPGPGGDAGAPLPAKSRLQGPQLEHLLPLICRSGRAYLIHQDPRNGEPGLRWDEGPVWDLHLTLARAPKQKKLYQLGGRLSRPGQSLTLPQAGLRFGGGLLALDGALGRLSQPAAAAWLQLLQGPEPLSVPEPQAGDFLAQYFGQAEAPELALPPELLAGKASQAPRPCLTLQKASSGRYHGNTQLVGEAHFTYSGQRVRSGQPQAQLYHAQQRRLILRDAAAEQAAMARLAELGFKPLLREPGRIQIHPQQAADALGALVLEGWSVEAEGKMHRAATEYKVEVRSGLDWFELALPIQFGALSPAVGELLAALKKGQGWVRLGDGSVGVLPADWLQSAGLLAGLGEEHGGVLRFKRSQAGLLDLLLANQAEERVSRDAGFNSAREALNGFQALKPAEAPKGFVGVLRPYQKDGLAWMLFLRRFGLGGCLADDMGLGKTVQVLALLEQLRAAKPGAEAKRPSLLVVPKSLVFNWQQEAARFTPQLKVLAHVGVERSKSAADFDAGDVVLTTYGTLRRDITLFQEASFDMLILDESQAAKNAASDTAKSIRLLKGAHRLALSGTPVENHLGELWTLFEFLNPGLLGASSAFKLAGGRDPDPATRALLGQALKPFILRRTKQKVAKDLPAKFEQTLFCELEPEQRQHYDQLRDHYRASLLQRVGRDGMGKSKIWVLEALLRLRQAACHPGLIDKAALGQSSAKLDALLPRLEAVAAEGHKALVFSQFTSFLSIVKARLDKAGLPYEYLDGQTKDRAAVVQRFQGDPDAKIFLISLKAGGVGLNLTAAEYVFLLDPWWNPAIEAQAVDRAHRLGQTRQVFAYRLVAKGTVEEKVLQLQETKRRLADDILQADENLIKSLTKADLEKLFS